MDLPYLTGDVPGIGGIIKQRPEDFFVEELPLYDPTGQGEHVYCQIQKINLTTFEAIDRIAAALNVHPRDIGYAGMKDAQAVTRQIFSILGTTEEAVMGLQIPDIHIQWTARHGNKLRLGHLKGNRFAIRIRQVNPTDVVKVSALLERLKTTGMPNYFGQQRFGRRNNNHLVGAALIRGDDREVLRLLLGDPLPKVDDPDSLAARQAYESADLDTAMRRFPRRCGMERRVLARLVKTARPGAAARLIDEKLRRLWTTALQSFMFNQVVADRIASLDRLIPGDLAMKEDNGAVFPVEDIAAEQPRCDRFEISPTGPLVGYRMTLPKDQALEIEQSAFAEAGLTPSDFRVEGRHKIKGARRPLRVKPEEVELSAGVDEHGSHVTIAFTLPSGSFATVLLRELMKTGDD